MNNKPAKVWKCIDCGVVVGRRVKRCHDCNQRHLTERPTYVRTPELRQRMSEIQKGKKHDWRSGSTRPEVAAKIREWWTPERKEKKRQEMLELYPDARYHGLSSTGAHSLVLSIGHCENCHGDGSESRLDVHHKDGNKHNQSPDNLMVLCHRCHMQEHAQRGETGFSVMWRKRKMNQD